MNIDGVDVDDGAVASGGWRPSHAPAMLALDGMPTLAGLVPGGLPVTRFAFDAASLSALQSTFPAFPPAPAVALTPGMAMMMQQQQQLAQLHQFTLQQQYQQQQPKQQPMQQTTPPPPKQILPRPTASETPATPAPAAQMPQSVPVARTPPPSAPVVQTPPPASVVDGSEKTEPQPTIDLTVEEPAATPVKSESEPVTSTASASPVKASRPTRSATAIPSDVHEIMVRAKEFRLKAPKQPTKKLTESRATGERPLDVALAEARIITRNVYVQRKPRKWEEDEVPICSCKRPESDDQMGCMEDCVNRAALIECLADFCPCGDKCDNQRIQRGLMPASEVINAGKKGLGIMVRQFIKQGDFVAEYMGEIVTEQEYHLRRLRYHHEKHRYMMVLSGGEVIDATRMGGLARFINHSCEPNCGVEKWEVDGEERCGIFALRDINSGEELSFDYKFQSFSSLEITTCLCGSAKCRGYIGVNNRAGKHHRKSSTSHTALLVERGKPLDPITKQGRSSRKTLEAALERMYRALAGHRMFTRKEIAMLLDSRLLLKRNVARHLDENLRLLCLEPYFVSEDKGEFGDMEPVFNVRNLPEFPQRPEDLTRVARQERLEVVLTRLRTQKR